MKTELIKIIRKVLKEQSEKNPLSRTEIKFFKILNEKKHEYKTKKDLMNFITSMMPFIGKSEGDGLLYYELYVMNYRPEGDYENITPEEFKDVRKLGKKRTENINAWKFTKAKIPFKGSNLEGEWSTDNYSVPYYVVKSYGWYPIFLFKENQWYEVTDTYSSSTSKQMSNAYPVRYDDNLQEKVIGVSKNEIQTLIYGTLTFQQLVKRRKSDFEELFKTTPELKKSYLISWRINYGDEPNKVKYKISDVKVDNDEIIINVDIEKAGKSNISAGYIHPSPFSQEMEDALENHITNKYYKHLKDNTVKFVFNHKSK
jgi:hypothetical protein